MIDERRDSLHHEDHKRPSSSQAAPTLGERPTKITPSRHERPSAQAGSRIGPRTACPRDHRDGCAAPRQGCWEQPPGSRQRGALPGISRSRAQERSFRGHGGRPFRCLGLRADLAHHTVPSEKPARSTASCPSRSLGSRPRTADPCSYSPTVRAAAVRQRQDPTAVGPPTCNAVIHERAQETAGHAVSDPPRQTPLHPQKRPGLSTEVESHGHDRCRKGDPVILRPGRPQRRPWSAQHLIRALTQ